ncbi:MAG: site-specific integrase [Parasphingorhabdus sp.]
MRIFKRPGSPNYQYDFTWNGQRYRSSTRETEKRKAELVAYGILQKIKDSPSGGGAWKITDVLGTYWEEHGQYQDSADFIWNKIENFDRLMDTKLPIEDLNGPLIMDYRASRRGEGVGGVTINRDLAILKAACKHVRLIHKVQIPGLEWKALKYKESEERVRFLSRDEFVRCMAHDDQDMAFAVFAAISTGLRKTAQLKIQMHQIDLKGRTITIPKGKGRKPQIVKISTQLMEMMLPHMAGSPTDYLFNRTNFRRRWESFRTDCDLVDFRWHDLRHTFGSWARQAGADLADIKEAMNHSDISVTMRYAHIDPDEHVTAFDRTANTIMAHSTAQSNRKKA